ncbi:hypothetical protein [Pseudaminobacter soli (ex Li et al. 2025)]|uniref:Uncharacterized protein n=1 Tax=Pseudaminobacter soli (ex Li et al. 2025) TaxID=1295366 RepID=A0A2P7S1B3_9HYPH|nr:hypothetical protein [Mesorhizobium soli]PSJ56265.1 hypothetical protein C7I85_25185 [Mesorhizobium soli]
MEITPVRYISTDHSTDQAVVTITFERVDGNRFSVVLDADEAFKMAKDVAEEACIAKEFGMTKRGDPDHPTRDTAETPAPNPNGDTAIDD